MRYVHAWRPAFLGTLIAASVAHAAVDFTPTTVTREFDGIQQTYIVFRDGQKEISYYPQAKWRLNDSGPKLTLVPEAVPNADAQVEVKSVLNPAPIGQPAVQQYVASAQQTVPRMAKNVAVIGSEINPLRICGYDTIAVDLQYEAFGATFQSRILYLNRDREQWTFRFTATAGTFDQTFEPFRSSLYSLSGL